jgi:hypothetical protein
MRLTSGMRAILWATPWAGLFLLACGARDARTASAPEAPSPEPAAASPEFAAPPPPAAPAGRPGEVSEQESRSEALPKDEGTSELELAEADLRRAQAELDSVFPPSRQDQPAAGAASAPRASRPGSAADSDAPKAKPEKKSAESSCATACRAFASLGRAASAVCRLAGENDTRCTQAKSVVSDAEKRVTSCRCRSE